MLSSPFAAVSLSGVPSSVASSAARAAIARLLATVSRQPNRPQRQAAPSSTTATWPISPAPKPSPWNSEPLRTRPAPIPRPTLIVTRFSARWPSAPNVYSARAAAWLSFATLDGRPYRSWRRPPSGRSCQSRLTAHRIVPVRVSTRPGVPTPMPRGVEVAFGEELVDEAEDEVERGVAVAAVDRQLDDAANLAAEVDERAREDALAQVEADDLAGVADDAEEDRGSCRRSTVPDRPPRPCPRRAARRRRRRRSCASGRCCGRPRRG